MTVRCTKKALALLKVGPRELVDPPPDEDDWYLNLLWLDRRKCILLVHAGTLFPIFVADVRVADLRPVREFVVAKIERALASEGLPLTCLGEPEATTLGIAKTASRSVLGFMNEMAFFLEYVIEDSGGMDRCDSEELSRDLRRRLYSRDGHTTPLELVARRLAS